MGNIVFENELLNKYFASEVGKEEYTLDDLNNLWDSKRTIDAKQVGQTLTQHDLDLLLSLNTVEFSGIDFTNLEIKNVNCEKIRFYSCDLKNANFDNNTVKKLEVDSCQMTEHIMQEIATTKGVEELAYIAEYKIDVDQLLKEHPDFRELSKSEQWDLRNKYPLREDINLENFSAFEELRRLRLENVKLGKAEIDALRVFKGLESLQITNSDIEENAEIPENIPLKSLTLPSLKSFKVLKNLDALESLDVYQDDCEYKDGQYLANCNVENLYLNGIMDVSSILPKSRNGAKIALVDCDISDVSQFLEYPNLNKLNLSRSNIGTDQLDTLSQIVAKGVEIRFENTEAKKILSEKEYVIEDESVAEAVKRVFGVWGSRNLNRYDVFPKRKLEDSTKIEGNKVLEVLVETGLIENIPAKKIKMELDYLDETVIDSVVALKDKLKYLQISSFNGLTNESIDRLEGTNWIVNGDSVTRWLSDTYYNSEDMKNILQAMDDIKISIPENATDLQKFLAVYACIGNHADYDKSGCIGMEEYIEGNENKTRSLKGVLLDGKAVCFGYALALKYCLDYVGIESNMVSGYAYGDPKKGHAWNQVRIDDNWYNVDLTWDYKKIRSGGELQDCLKSDDVFYKTHTATDKVQACDLDYSMEKIYSEIRKVQVGDRHKEIAAEIAEGNKESENTQKLVTVADLSKLAMENSINPSTLNDLKQISQNNIEGTKEREAIPENEF